MKYLYIAGQLQLQIAILHLIRKTNIVLLEISEKYLFHIGDQKVPAS